MQKDIKHQWIFPHSPEIVWAHLTQPELLSQWLMESDFRPEIGHQFQFHTKPKINVGFDGNIYCEVLELIPFKRISYSWKGGPGNGKITLDSVVTWTLNPTANGTELILEHTGFKGFRNYLSYLIMNKGWLKIAHRLANDLSSYKYDTTNT